MASPLRILTTPVRAAASPRLAHLAMLLAADTLVRHARATGVDAEWFAATVAGDLAEQHAVERALAREGLDRFALGRDEFVARVKATEAANRLRTAEFLSGLAAPVDLDRDALDTAAVVRAARIAFVRLYEAGLLTLAERVVGTCPRCITTVDAADTDPVELPTTQLLVRLPTEQGDDIDIEVTEPELLVGAVALTVPAGHPAAGSRVMVPIAGREVPVIEAGETTSRLVVPAHEQADLDVARGHSLAPIRVLDESGTVVVEGPLHGLGRYAARAAAHDLLAAEGVVVSTAEIPQPSGRCRRCGTALVPLLGRHWFLPMRELEGAVGDAIRQGELAVTPSAARAELLDGRSAPADGDDATTGWCLSHQVWGGLAVPVATCLDCGQATVSAELPESCGRCMGQLVPDDDVLDARFVGAVWALAVAGWPDREKGPTEAAPDTVLLVTPSGLRRWALPMAVLGLRLASTVPFATVAVQPAPEGPDHPDPELDELEGLAAQDPAALRLALIGGLTVDEVRSALDVLVQGAGREGGSATDVTASAAAAVDAAFAAWRPGQAVPALVAAAHEGVGGDELAALRAWLRPFTGS